MNSEPAIGAEHFADIQDDQPAAAGDGEIAGDVQAPGAPGALLSREAFSKNFHSMFHLGGRYVVSLKITSDEAQSARDAADALYDTCLDCTWLRFLVQPESAWAGRCLVIASFAVPKAVMVSAEVRAKRGARPDQAGVQAFSTAFVPEPELPPGAKITG